MRPPTPTRGASASKPAAPAPAQVKQLTQGEWELKMKSTLDELLHSKDMKVSHSFPSLAFSMRLHPANNDFLFMCQS